MILVDALAQQPFFAGKPSDAKGNKVFSIPAPAPVIRIAPNVAIAGHLTVFAIQLHVQPQAVAAARVAHHHHRAVALCRGLAQGLVNHRFSLRPSSSRRSLGSNCPVVVSRIVVQNAHIGNIYLQSPIHKDLKCSL